MTVLILGGTSEGRELAAVLADGGVEFLSSLAGRVARPRLPVGDVRIGGFGGVAGLKEFLVERGISAVVDATHPFAEGMSHNAAAACTDTGVPLLRLERPSWAAAGHGADWVWADDHAAAARLASGRGHRPFLTVGRQSLEHFLGPLGQHTTLVRVVDVPEVRLPAGWRLITSRGPYELGTERALLREHDIDVLVTKDSGGQYTWPKMAAAAELGISIVVVRRGRSADAVATVSDVHAAAEWAAAPA